MNLMNFVLLLMCCLTSGKELCEIVVVKNNSTYTVTESELNNTHSTSEREIRN